MRTPEQIRAERLVTDLPIWTDCPFRYSKKHLEVRRGKFEDHEPEIIVIWNPAAQKHVDLAADGISATSFAVAKQFLYRYLKSVARYG